MSNEETDRHISDPQIGPNRAPVPRKELKRIAIGLHHGQVFTNLHIPEGENWIAHFMPLALASREMISDVLAVVDPEGQHDEHGPGHDHDEDEVDAERPLGLVYEWIHKAMPMGVNGLPVFASAKLLSPSETTTVLDMVARLERAQDEALRGHGK